MIYYCKKRQKIVEIATQTRGNLHFETRHTKLPSFSFPAFPPFGSLRSPTHPLALSCFCGRVCCGPSPAEFSQRQAARQFVWSYRGVRTWSSGARISISIRVAGLRVCLPVCFSTASVRYTIPLPISVCISAGGMHNSLLVFGFGQMN